MCGADEEVLAGSYDMFGCLCIIVIIIIKIKIIEKKNSYDMFGCLCIIVSEYPYLRYKVYI